jgi:hypothetical protein
MPNLMKLGYLRRGIVILLLAIAFVDLAVIDMIAPQLCNDGFATMAVAAPQQNAAENLDQKATVEAAISDQGSLPQQNSHSDSSPDSTEEDCFCCCSHILPGYTVNHMTLNTMPRVDIPLIASLPSPPPQDTFHPPRSA